ncbi:hypothetical protein TREMEDRAFT_60312 [Tremella mesenterica DSM 1558]|uniref:uncharacterized protein n=1 Tax=Tremella mesenterica (strain ATCC 24925 / CBS 8224 / DSM 1558 / NBRC 9311 / NRRL Y-6157 / RJB 2259-6 / UBC 559-6) TaxID=578456 RepID=UPI0003F498FD|nr:uncharacterized protein TREMEDRAFT_60312 [Tremella mesenterica DSM 1558]EIW71382.1 hypothetical protein TREMEDRAFT_60312 [Tremella mesenterica DSM 1558]
MTSILRVLGVSASTLARFELAEELSTQTTKGAALILLLSKGWSFHPLEFGSGTGIYSNGSEIRMWSKGQDVLRMKMTTRDLEDSKRSVHTRVTVPFEVIGNYPPGQYDRYTSVEVRRPDVGGEGEQQLLLNPGPDRRAIFYPRTDLWNTFSSHRYQVHEQPPRFHLLLDYITLFKGQGRISTDRWITTGQALVIPLTHMDEVVEDDRVARDGDQELLMTAAHVQRWVNPWHMSQFSGSMREFALTMALQGLRLLLWNTKDGIEIFSIFQELSRCLTIGDAKTTLKRMSLIKLHEPEDPTTQGISFQTTESKIYILQGSIGEPYGTNDSKPRICPRTKVQCV